MRTRSLWRPLQMEIRLPSQQRRREIAERPSTRLSHPPSLSAIKIALLDGPLYDPVFQNISVIGSGGSGLGREAE